MEWCRRISILAHIHGLLAPLQGAESFYDLPGIFDARLKDAMPLASR